MQRWQLEPMLLACMLYAGQGGYFGKQPPGSNRLGESWGSRHVKDNASGSLNQALPDVDGALAFEGFSHFDELMSYVKPVQRLL